MGYGPLPSFLIQTPLGTPHEETVDFQSRAEIAVIGQVKGMANLALFRKTLVQPKQASPKLKQKVGEAKKQAKFPKRVGEDGFIRRWFSEEVRLSMSKMSIMSLVLGLLFLGSLFFIIGFLAAVATLKFDAGRQDSTSAWQASNANPQQEQVPSRQGSKLGLAASAGSNLVTGAIQKQLAPLGKIVKATSAVIPRPLQPFARYGIGSAHAEVQKVGVQVNPFHPRRMGASEQPHYGETQQQPLPMPQQYPPQQGQPPYGAIAPSNQPIPQGSYYGQGGYAPLQQQSMMQQPMQQQPYYQHPPHQQMVPQPMMASQPPMVPQQQQMMVQQPPYPQQMIPQQGYYR